MHWVTDQREIKPGGIVLRKCLERVVTGDVWKDVRGGISGYGPGIAQEKSGQSSLVRFITLVVGLIVMRIIIIKKTTVTQLSQRHVIMLKP